MIRKAVIPAAGFGTRFLPATKAVPKELVPLVDVPIIQRVVEEAAAAGITDIIIIVSRGKEAIADHFDRDPELEGLLEKKGRAAELESIRKIGAGVKIHYVRQPEMNGLGDAVRCAREHVGDESFAVLLGDAVMDSPEPCIGRLMDLHEKTQAPVIGVETVEWEKVSRYGIVGGEETEPGVVRVERLVEKPSRETAPSNLAIAARYVLTPDIFDHLEKIPRGVGGEVQLTDAIASLLQARPVYACQVPGKRWDIGNPLGFLKATVHFGACHPVFGEEFRKYLAEFSRPL